MADTRITPSNFFRAVRLCFKVLLMPELMKREEEMDAQIRLSMAPAPNTQPNRAVLIQRAFFSSLGLVLVSGLIGYAAGKMMFLIGRCADSSTTTWLQVASAAVLLWATLFIRGWEIQSFGGVTLAERVNQWLYRTMCCVGTVIGVYSLAFSACKQ